MWHKKIENLKMCGLYHHPLYAYKILLILSKPTLLALWSQYIAAYFVLKGAGRL